MQGLSRTVLLFAPLALSTLTAAGVARAELELPRESPPARVSQQVGLTEVVIEYASPAVNGRKIWGALVAYDRPWPISPSFPATIRFSRDVLVGDRAIAAGAYRLTVIPTRDKTPWTIALSRVPAPGAPLRSDGDTDGGTVRVKVAAKAAPLRERLIFVFSAFNEDKASLDLEWERVRVSIPIATHTSQQVADEINELDNVWRS